MIKHFFRKTQQTLKNFTEKVASIKNQQQEVEVCKSSIAEDKKDKKMEIIVSAGTMAKFVVITMLLLLIAMAIFQIRDILVIFFVSVMFAAALDPMVDALERRRIPRSIGIIIIYLIVLLALGIFISNLVPIIANEVSSLATHIQDFITNVVSGKIVLPKFLDGLKPSLQRAFEGVDVSKVGNYKDVLLNIAQRLSDVAGNVFNAIMVIFNGFVNTILILVITFMMTVDEAGIERFLLSLFPSRHAEYIRKKSNLIKEKTGYWLRGQIVLCVVVGVLVYIGLLIIGFFTQPVEYAATIAFLAGLTELIPYAGPFLAWLIGLPIVANQSPMLIVWMTVLMYIVQLLENNLIVPLIMNKAVGLSPIFVMFALMVGFEFLGILGMVLAVPVATALAIFLKDYSERAK
jgi:predicted PurR-regulated permease PerM